MTPRLGGAAAPAISVVVPTRDRAARLERLLEALRTQTVGVEAFEVIVVDDGSSDATASVLAEAEASDGLSVRSIRRRVSRGPAAARNQGWLVAEADLVAFVDDDCEPTPQWLERALAAARKHPGFIVAGPTTPIPAEADRIGPFARTRDLPGPDEWFASCNIVYPRDLLGRLDGFDETRFGEALGEDTDLGWRARELGAELHFEPSAAVHHAVDEVGAIAALREALLGADAIYAFRRHPELRRRTLWLGFVRNPALPGLLLAAFGLALARRHRWAAALALPYALSVARRCAGPRAGLGFAPFFIVRDALALTTALRGSLRHRTLVL
jgi:glycosyltransferase involved in cell wall biosynthesis